MRLGGRCCTEMSSASPSKRHSSHQLLELVRQYSLTAYSSCFVFDIFALVHFHRHPTAVVVRVYVDGCGYWAFLSVRKGGDVHGHHCHLFAYKLYVLFMNALILCLLVCRGWMLFVQGVATPPCEYCIVSAFFLTTRCVFFRLPVAGGFVSGTFYRKLGGTQWVHNVFVTVSIFAVCCLVLGLWLSLSSASAFVFVVCSLLQAPCFIMWFFLNMIAVAYDSTAALPFGTIMAILAIYFLVRGFERALVVGFLALAWVSC